MTTTNQTVPHHACRPDDPTKCSQCTLAYACMRESQGGTWNWLFTAVAGFAILALFVR